MFSQMFSQTPRVLEWSIGEPEITCGTTNSAKKICYPLMVSISDDADTPVLGTSTMRFFYDDNLLENISIDNLATGYSESGFSQSASVFGDVFGFSSSEGVFAQFNIIDGATSSPLALSTTSVHVLDICFDLAGDITFPLCAPIVLDNNHLGKGNGISEDDGYLQNDAGVVGTYLLNGDFTNAILADDEVINYQWIDNGTTFDGTANDLTDRTGDTDTNNCIVDPTPTAEAGATDELTCTTTSLQLNGSGTGQGTLSYAWEASAGGNITAGANTATPTIDAPGTYTLTVTYNGCTATDFVEITEDTDLPVADAGSGGTITCSTTSIQIGTAGAAGFTYAWTPAAGLDDATLPNPTASAAGTYSLVV
ncbi:hypothetical protein DIS18_14320, partial [Algibacter marinivivus]